MKTINKNIKIDIESELFKSNQYVWWRTSIDGLRFLPILLVINNVMVKLNI